MLFDSRNTYLWHPWQVLQVVGLIENHDWEGQTEYNVFFFQNNSLLTIILALHHDK